MDVDRWPVGPILAFGTGRAPVVNVVNVVDVVDVVAVGGVIIAAVNTDPAGSRLLDGRFELGEQLGAGGMARVHRATDVQLGRDVAVKLVDLRTDIDGQARSRVGRSTIGPTCTRWGTCCTSWPPGGGPSREPPPPKPRSSGCTPTRRPHPNTPR